MKVTEKFIKPESMKEFKELVVKHGQLEGFIQLGGCGIRSSKSILPEGTPTGQFRFGVCNDIDGSWQSLSIKTIYTRSNIGEAVDKGCWWFHRPMNYKKSTLDKTVYLKV